MLTWTEKLFVSMIRVVGASAGLIYLAIVVLAAITATPIYLAAVFILATLVSFGLVAASYYITARIKWERKAQLRRETQAAIAMCEYALRA